MRLLLASLAVGMTALASVALGVPPASDAQSSQVDCAHPVETADLRIVAGVHGRGVELIAPEYRMAGCDEPNDPLTVAISWGDGVTTPAELLPSPSSDPRGYLVRGSHVYARASSRYDVVITIRNDRTGVERRDRHYRAVIAVAPRLAAYFTDRETARSALFDIRVSKTTREVTLNRPTDVSVRLPASVLGDALGHVKLTTNGVRRTLTLRALRARAHDRRTFPLVRRGSGLSVQLRTGFQPFLRISRIPSGTTRIIVHFRDAGRSVVRLTDSCPAMAWVYALVTTSDQFASLLTATSRLRC